MSQGFVRQQFHVFTRPLAFYGASVALAAVLFLAGCALLVGALPIGDLGAAGFVLIGAGLLLGLSVVWRRSAFELVIGADRIEFRQGVFSREEHVVMTDMVVGVDLLQTFGDRAIGIGTIVIGTTGMDAVRCVGISRPRVACDLIRGLHSNVGGGGRVMRQ